MTETLPAPPHVVALRITGRTGEVDTAAVFAALDDAARTHAQIGLYVEIGWIVGVPHDQFVADVGDGLEALAERGSVARVAVVADSYRRRAVVRDAGEQSERFALSVFPPAARAAALAWASAAPVA